MKQRVKLWMTDTSTHTVTMDLEDVASLLEQWRRDEAKTLQVTMDAGTMLYFNTDCVACFQVDNLEEGEKNEGGRARRGSAKSRRSAS